MTSNRRTAIAGLLMAGVTALCRCASLGKELVVASVFGAGAVIDAYALAALVPAVAMALVVNPLRRAFQTQYAAHEARGPDAAADFAGLYLGDLLLAAAGLALIVLAGLRPLWPHLLPDEALRTAGADALVPMLQAVTLPTALLLVPMSLVAGLVAVLNAARHFSRPQLTFFLPPLCTLGAVLIHPHGGTATLVWGLLVGTVLQSGLLAAMVRAAGGGVRLRIGRGDPARRGLWLLGGAVVVFDLLAQGNTYVDRSMAGGLETGAISVLYWSGIMKDFFAGTLFAALFTVFAPRFSQMLAAGETDELRRTCGLILRCGALAMVPVSALLVVCGPPVLSHVRLGALDRQATGQIAGCLAAYGAGLFPDLAAPILMQVLVALGRRRTLVALGLFASFLPNIALNLLLVGRFGTVGLASATSLVSMLVLVASWVLVRREIGIDEEPRTVRTVAFAALGAGLGIPAGYWTVRAIRNLFAGDPWWGAVLAAAAGGAVLLAVYALTVCTWPGNVEARTAWRAVRERWRRKRSA